MWPLERTGSPAIVGEREQMTASALCPDGSCVAAAVPDGSVRLWRVDELGSGDVQPKQFFGRHLAMFRTAAGLPVLLDAYCPHLGAHLGQGAEVVGRRG